MINLIKKFILIFIVCLLFIPSVYANDNKNLVNIYLFHSNSCHHCASEKELLAELEKEYDNIRIYKYEIGINYESLPFDRFIDKEFTPTEEAIKEMLGKNQENPEGALDAPQGQ